VAADATRTSQVENAIRHRRVDTGEVAIVDRWTVRSTGAVLDPEERRLRARIILPVARFDLRDGGTRHLKVVENAGDRTVEVCLHVGSMCSHPEASGTLPSRNCPMSAV
jgi:hypothetical protein